jgi:hypothetical protein
MLTDAPRLHPITLRFPPDWEKAYAEGTLERFRLQTRVAFAVALCNLLGVGAWFLATVPVAQGGRAIGLAFMVSAIPALLALIVALSPLYRRGRGIALGGSILGTGLALAGVSLLVPTNLGATVTTVSVVVVLLFGFVFLSTSLADAAPAGLVVAVAALAATAYAGEDWAYRSAFWLGIFSALAGSAGAGYFVEKYVRRDFAQARLLEAERHRSERLLLNVLPAPIAERLKSGEEPIADAYPETTVLFADIVDFTGISSRVSPDQMVGMLNAVFIDSRPDMDSRRSRRSATRTWSSAGCRRRGSTTPRRSPRWRSRCRPWYASTSRRPASSCAFGSGSTPDRSSRA